MSPAFSDDVARPGDRVDGVPGGRQQDRTGATGQGEEQRQAGAALGGDQYPWAQRPGAWSSVTHLALEGLPPAPQDGHGRLGQAQRTPRLGGPASGAEGLQEAGRTRARELERLGSAKIGSAEKESGQRRRALWGAGGAS